MRNNKGQFTDGSHGVETRFKREDMIGNKFAKGNPKNATTFGVIDVTMKNHPQWKGGISASQRDGVRIRYASKKTMSLARFKWIQAYESIPEGYTIIHIDGDKQNNELNNLECISRAELLKRNRRI